MSSSFFIGNLVSPLRKMADKLDYSVLFLLHCFLYWFCFLNLFAPFLSKMGDTMNFQINSFLPNVLFLSPGNIRKLLALMFLGESKGNIGEEKLNQYQV